MADEKWLEDAPPEIRKIYEDLELGQVPQQRARNPRRKTARRKTAPRKTRRRASRKTTRGKSRYSEAARKFIEKRMRDFKAGRMRTGVGGVKGRRGPVVRSRQKALAIAISEARAKGMKVPAQPGRKNPLDLMIIGNPAANGGGKIQRDFRTFHGERPAEIIKLQILDGYRGPMMVVGNLSRRAANEFMKYDIYFPSQRRGRWKHRPGDRGRGQKTNPWKNSYLLADDRGYLHIGVDSPRQPRFVPAKGIVG